MTTAVFYPSSVSAWSQPGGGTTPNNAAADYQPTYSGGIDTATIRNPAGGGSAQAYFDFSSLPADATFNWLKFESMFGWGDAAPTSDIFAYLKKVTTGEIIAGGVLVPSGWSIPNSDIMIPFAYPVYGGFSMAQVRAGAVRVDFGGGYGRFDYFRVVVDYTPASAPPPTEETAKSNVVVTAVRSSGDTVASGSAATTTITVANNSTTATATNVVVTTTADSAVQTRTFVRSDTAAQVAGEINVTLATIAPGASVTFTVTDVIKSTATGLSYSCAGSVSVGSSNVTASPMAFASGVTTVVLGRNPVAPAGQSFMQWLNPLIPNAVATYVVPNDEVNPNWEIKHVRLRVSAEARLWMSERNFWTLELVSLVSLNGVGIDVSADWPTLTAGATTAGRTEFGGSLDWEQLVPVIAGQTLRVEVRARLQGNFVAPANTGDNTVYVSPIRIEFDPRS